MKRLIILLAILAILSSCKYEKLLKSKDYRLKYEKALQYYAKEDYTRADGLFEQLKPILKGSKEADTVFFYSAYCNYYQKDYLLGAHFFSEFRRTFGNSPFAEEAEFMSAYCYYKLSPRPDLDQAYSGQAISNIGLYLSKYPNSKRKDECIKIIEELRNKLVEKSYMSAKLYYNLGDYKAAVIALNNSIEQYPETKYREEIMFLILKASYLLADNSVFEKQVERFQATVDEYYTFIDEYPKSDFRSEADKMFGSSQKRLKN
ncbi:MAG: outer membrane protein assembly factor BamD [Marinilabiliales bacterium]|nr:outer membrane protein assembly factor BamD [Marinilabiliales bacterium]